MSDGRDFVSLRYLSSWPRRINHPAVLTARESGRSFTKSFTLCHRPRLIDHRRTVCWQYSLAPEQAPGLMRPPRPAGCLAIQRTARKSAVRPITLQAVFSPKSYGGAQLNEADGRA